jgi:hypothetical protein
MILLTKVHSKDDSETIEGININNLIGANESHDGQVWIRYWDGAEVRRMVVKESISEVAKRMNYARSGGELGYSTGAKS